MNSKRFFAITEQPTASDSNYYTPILRVRKSIDVDLEKNCVSIIRLFTLTGGTKEESRFILNSLVNYADSGNTPIIQYISLGQQELKTFIVDNDGYYTLYVKPNFSGRPIYLELEFCANENYFEPLSYRPFNITKENFTSAIEVRENIANDVNFFNFTINPGEYKRALVFNASNSTISKFKFSVNGVATNNTTFSRNILISEVVFYINKSSSGDITVLTDIPYKSGLFTTENINILYLTNSSKELEIWFYNPKSTHTINLGVNIDYDFNSVQGNFGYYLKKEGITSSTNIIGTNLII